MAKIKLDQVTIEIPVFGGHSRSLKNSFLKRLVDGGSQDITSITALSNVSLNLKDGDRLGVMGPNGAGKSTLLRTIAGIYEPTSGSIDVKGKIASLIDISLGMNPEATGYENIRMRGIMMGLSLNEIKSLEEEIADFTELGSFLKMPTHTYSTGMHMRLGFAVSTSVPADIILMDEWLSVGDNDFMVKAERRLQNYIEKSSILVIASHSENLISKLTNQVIRLEHKEW